ncbi:MAG: flavodoxin family protein [Bacilli bacterium]|jgi:multimeric flavodoxin WrbA|nr:flavodoxin family protein [Bacilli bacterium]MCH4210782.1 flavodoxin family protein [Bacilli bacterium]MCH4277879.1 flavodoxin family protein [Bacilli bacterium]MCI2055306.1 flavodoxin family protein [Bacilli bacterium]
MKVLLVNGSPHKDGCVNRALEEVRNTLVGEGVEAEIFWIGNARIGGCSACGYCHGHDDGCVYKDIVNEFAKKCEGADAFVFGSPTYYAGMAGNMKGFMDRLFYSNGKYLKGKLGAAVISSRRGGSTSVFDEMNKYFTISEMPIVSSCYWNEVHGHNKEEVEKDEEGLLTMRVLGRNMAYLLKCIEAGTKAGVKKPAKEKRVYTNFVR